MLAESLSWPGVRIGPALMAFTPHLLLGAEFTPRADDNAR